MTTSARPSSTVRGVALVSLLAVAAFATFMISPALGGTTSNLVAVEALAPDLAVHLGIYGGAAVAIWDAFTQRRARMVVLDVFWGGSTTRAALERAVPRYAVLNAASGVLLAIAGAFEATVL